MPKDGGTGQTQSVSITAVPKTHTVRLLDNTGKAYPFTGKERCGSHILPRRSYVEKYIWTNPVGQYYIWKYWGDSKPDERWVLPEGKTRVLGAVEYPIWDPRRVTHMEPSLNPVLKDTTE